MSKEQIEEMAEHLIEIQRSFNEYCAKPCRECEMAGIVNCENHYKAEALYNAGYRKQSEGEWETIQHNPRGEMFNVYSHICKVEGCGYFYKDIRPYGHKFCPNCGAKMNGV